MCTHLLDIFWHLRVVNVYNITMIQYSHLLPSISLLPPLQMSGIPQQQQHDVPSNEIVADEPTDEVHTILIPIPILNTIHALPDP